jgi:hypothetical protein
MVRTFLSVHMKSDGTGFDFERMFSHVPAMREAGVTEFVAAIERYIHDIAAFAARY